MDQNAFKIRRYAIHICMKLFKFVFTVSPYNKNVIYIRKYRKGLSVQLSSKYFSKLHINMFAYVGAIFFPIAVP